MAAKFKPCSVPGCNGNAHSSSSGKRGWCARHYRRWVKHGDPTGGRTDNGVLEKFIKEIAVPYNNRDRCLEWPYGTSNNGYGTIHYNLDGSRRKHFVHRLVCEMVHGAPPASADAAHSCGNRLCVNPKHLRWATRQENMEDARSHGTLYNRPGQSKLGERDIPVIRDRLARGHKVTHIANDFNVTFGCIDGIKRGKNWRWVA
jgi:hypothetical protein